ncbi:MAG: hypothetical protein N4A45_07030 [Flavobacteriales bacterium]|jgi:tetratricopeptide (TPR) repeat protein|nr:hypothetical protein [Flavobacteriales bacterium]
MSAVFIFLISLQFGFAQEFEIYNQKVKEANSLLKTEQYKEASEKYEEALANAPIDLPHHQMDAAKAFSMAGNKDKAFFYLSKMIDQSKFRMYDYIVKDLHFQTLHEDPRWKEILVAILINKNEYEKHFDKEVVGKLDTVRLFKEMYREKYFETVKEYGEKSQEVSEALEQIRSTDSLNFEIVSEILDRKGWQPQKRIGLKGSHTLYTTILETKLENQLKYLPMIREAYKEGNVSSTQLSFIEDQVALKQRNKQIYGSQLGRDSITGKPFLLPVEDPENVNKRRHEIGLPKIEIFLSVWNIQWDPKEHL